MSAYQVPVSGIPLLQDPPFVAGLVLLATAIGRRALVLCRVPSGDVTALERGVLAAALGFGFLQYLPFALGVAGVLTPRAVWAGLALAALVFLVDIGRVLRALFRALTAPETPPPRWLAIGALLLALPLSVALFDALCPPTEIDTVYYHLTAPKRWLQAGELSYLPTLLQTNLMMGVNMLYTIALAVWSDTAAKLIHFALGLLALFAVYALGVRLASRRVGFFAAALWLLALYTVPTLDAIRLFSFAYVDLGITLEIVSAALAFVLFLRSGARGWLTVAALAAGFAASFKLTGVMAGSALALVLGLELVRQRRPWHEALLAVIGFGALSLLPALPWFVRSWVQTGSPIYPALASLLPTRDWPPEAARAFSAFFKYYVWGAGYGGTSWSLGARKLLRGAAMLGALAFTALALWRVRERESRAIAVLCGSLLLFCFWSTGLYVRYVLPALPLGYVLGLSWLERAEKLRRPLYALATLVIALNALLFLRGSSPGALTGAEVASGRITRSEYLNRPFSVMPLWDFVNQKLPPGSHILLPAGRSSYYMEPYCYLTEAYYQARIRMDSWSNFLSDLRRDRIEYAIVPKGSERSAPIGPEYAPVVNELPFAHRLVAEYGELLYTAGSDSLYRLRPLDG